MVYNRKSEPKGGKPMKDESYFRETQRESQLIFDGRVLHVYKDKKLEKLEPKEKKAPAKKACAKKTKKEE